MNTLVDGACLEFAQAWLEQSVNHNLKAIALSEQVDQPVSEAHARYDLNSALLGLGDAKGAESNALALMTPAKRSGMLAWQVKAMESSESVAAAKGDWVKAREFSNQGLALDPRQSTLLGSRTLLEYQTGDFDAGEAFLDQLMESGAWNKVKPIATVTMEIPIYSIPALVIPVIARISGVARRLEDAEFIARQSIAGALQLGPQVAAHIGLALIAVQRGDADEAAKHYPILVPLKGLFFPLLPFGHPLAVDRVLGLICHCLGRADDAAVHFEAAIDFCQQSGYLPELAWSCFDFACSLPGDQGEKVDSLFKQALAIASELGMRPLMARVAELK
jgi:tetratricopeptide (TPR) repeat protein